MNSSIEIDFLKLQGRDAYKGVDCIIFEPYTVYTSVPGVLSK